MFAPCYASICPPETAVLHSGKTPEASGHVSHWLPCPCFNQPMMLSCNHKDPLHLEHLSKVFPLPSVGEEGLWWTVCECCMDLSLDLSTIYSHQVSPRTVKALLKECLVYPHLSKEQISFERTALPILRATEQKLTQYFNLCCCCSNRKVTNNSLQRHGL